MATRTYQIQRGNRKPVTVIQYDTLIECFRACMGWEPDRQPNTHDYWFGHDGSRAYRTNVKRWLKNCTRGAWGWAHYHTKTIHCWIARDCPIHEIVAMFAHEMAHLRKPRPNNTMEEEKKASLSERDAAFAYLAMQTSQKEAAS